MFNEKSDGWIGRKIIRPAPRSYADEPKAKPRCRPAARIRKRMDELSKPPAEPLDVKEKAVSRLLRPWFDGKDAACMRFGAATRSALPFWDPARHLPLRPGVKV